ncbi:hypothetical protein PLESTB_001095300 [Pleodorina starrii]|uniref:Phytanoyl-CoA dioxygenase n=1 Tax=Pleodorina starrii TaxID=330485 RepID=A0A9W6BQZ9_9CHLO|nr:hypothetical protein PLESTB_001095300 [Pleodorina starrii]
MATQGVLKTLISFLGRTGKGCVFEVSRPYSVPPASTRHGDAAAAAAAAATGTTAAAAAGASEPLPMAAAAAAAATAAAPVRLPGLGLLVSPRLHCLVRSALGFPPCFSCGGGGGGGGDDPRVVRRRRPGRDAHGGACCGDSRSESGVPGAAVHDGERGRCGKDDAADGAAVQKAVSGEQAAAAANVAGAGPMTPPREPASASPPSATAVATRLTTAAGCAGSAAAAEPAPAAPAAPAALATAAGATASVGTAEAAAAAARAGAAAAAGGPYLFNEQFIVKPPRSSGRAAFGWHRDSDWCRDRAEYEYGPYVSVWTALDNMTAVNGALAVVAGSHIRDPSPAADGGAGEAEGRRVKRPRREEEEKEDGVDCAPPPAAAGPSAGSSALAPPGGADQPQATQLQQSQRQQSQRQDQQQQPQGQQLLLQGPAEHLFVPEGTVVVFLDTLLHASGPNRSPHTRRAWMPQFSSQPIRRTVDERPVALAVPLSTL